MDELLCPAVGGASQLPHLVLLVVGLASKVPVGRDAEPGLAQRLVALEAPEARLVEPLAARADVLGLVDRLAAYHAFHT